MTAPDASAKLWHGRFAESTDAAVERFSESVSFDARLYAQDIVGSTAHARMLGRVGVLSTAEVDAIVDGLAEIRAEIEAGKFRWQTAREDVHMNIEAALTERIGEAGKKLHTGRSRNDQVATDVRLYVRDAIDALRAQLDALMRVLVDIAEREHATIMPGFTHLQTAQPVTFGHHMLAWYEMLRRDSARLADARRRTNVLPLGAAALAGTTFPIDRESVARELGFDDVCANSLDAVSDRDFAIETTAACALLMTHLSRMSEELVMWCSAQFGFVELGDAFCTGSSIMPQKKNPDIPELTRGKSARVIGNLQALLVLMKGQPLAYNRDNQEDKEPLFDALDTASSCVQVFTAMLPSLETHPEAMREAALRGYSTATDLADYLVRRGVPFRDAHAVVGAAVRAAIEQGKDLAELDFPTLSSFSDAISQSVYDVLTVEGSVAARNHVGGTAPTEVRAAAARARAALEATAADSGAATAG